LANETLVHVQISYQKLLFTAMVRSQYILKHKIIEKTILYKKQTWRNRATRQKIARNILCSDSSGYFFKI